MREPCGVELSDLLVKIGSRHFPVHGRTKGIGLGREEQAVDTKTIERLRLVEELLRDGADAVYTEWRTAKDTHGWGSVEEKRLNGSTGDLHIALERVEQVRKILEGK